jgi:hypothetical protein
MTEDIIFDDYNDEWSSVPSHKEHMGFFFTCSSGESFKNFCYRKLEFGKKDTVPSAWSIWFTRNVRSSALE